MKTKINTATTIIFVVLILVLTSFNLQSEEMNENVCIITPDFFQKQNQMGAWSIGFEMIQMPRSVTGEELLYLPMVNAEYKVDVSENVNARLSFNSCYLINLAGAGFNYSHSDEDMMFEAGIAGKFWFGQAELDLIKAESHGVLLSPSVSTTYFMEDFALIVKAEADFFVSQKYRLSGANFSRSASHYSGASFTLTYQQPLVGNVKLNLSTKLNLTQLSYHQWLTYSANGNAYFLPSFGAGLSF